MEKLKYLSIFIVFLSGFCLANNNIHSEHKSKYMGEEKRRIKSLSKQDILELKNGRGWGLAKAAELNGVPGPVHVLEMAKEIDLTPQQKKLIEQLFNNIKEKATNQGMKFIELERSLNDQFKAQTITKSKLKAQLKLIAQARQDLRYIHLEAHLSTLKILSKKQVKTYNRLRGYEADPCKSVPKGHNPEMWRKHNGCQ